MRTYSKPPLTVDEQIALLRKRGMKIEDPAAAKEALSRISYYRLSAYWYPMRRPDSPDQFKPGTSFAEVLRLYDFDRKLRLVVLSGIESVEVRLRTVLIDHIGHAFGAFGHRMHQIARDGNLHSEWLERLDQEVKRSREVFVTHYKINYIGYPEIPIWMAFEVASLGSLSILFANSVTSLQRKICWRLSCPPPPVLKSWLQSLT